MSNMKAFLFGCNMAKRLILNNKNNKTCTECKKELPKQNFWFDKKYKKYKSKCKKCLYLKTKKILRDKNKVFTCHICNLQTKLNIMLSSHAKKHVNKSLLKDQYKKQLLKHNGILPENCRFCHKETIIARKGNYYPKYHKECYLKTLKHKGNPSYRGHKKELKCKYCSKSFYRYISTITSNKNAFCSLSCSTKFYSIPENMSDKKKKAVIKNKETIKKIRSSLKFKIKRNEALLYNKNNRTSKKEKQCIDIIKKKYPNTIHGYMIKYYVFDGFIPETNTLIEFDGTYWHSLLKTKALDKRKNLYIKKYHKHLKLIRIPEQDWDNAEDKEEFIFKKV